MHVAFGRLRRKTEPTGPGKDIELPIYFFKVHEQRRTPKQNPTESGDGLCLPQ